MKENFEFVAFYNLCHFVGGKFIWFSIFISSFAINPLFSGSLGGLYLAA
jgi:hypothetical protein